MGIYNILSCSGFGETAGYMASGPCTKARLGVVVLFFLIAIIRKWGGEEVGLEFNFLFALAFGLLSYFLVITFTGHFGIAFLIGLVLSVIGGYGSGLLGFGGGSE